MLPLLISQPETISRNAAIGNKPFYFSAKIPEGNYEVKMVFGDAKTASNTTVKAESRRLMLENIQTKAGKAKNGEWIYLNPKAII